MNLNLLEECQLVVRLGARELFNLNELALTDVFFREIKPPARFLFRDISLLVIQNRDELASSVEVLAQFVSLFLVIQNAN